MIWVPDAARLPMTPRPVRLENSAMISGANPFGKTGNGRSSTIPIISQWPVTESFPADASAIRPYAPVRAPSSGAGPIAATRPRPSERNVGSARGTRLAMLPSVSLPWSPYALASGNSPMPTLSMTMTMTREYVDDTMVG